MNLFIDVLNKADPVIRFTMEVKCSTILIMACVGVLLFFALKHI